jgi:hypothetical protein
MRPVGGYNLAEGCAQTELRFRANTIRLEWLQRLVLSKPSGSITDNMQHAQKPDAISLPASRASTTRLGAIQRSAISARSRWS